MSSRSAWSGFIFQAMGIMFEASRLVAIQKLLHGLKMDPLVSLYWFAPVRLAKTLTAQMAHNPRRSLTFFLFFWF